MAVGGRSAWTRTGLLMPLMPSAHPDADPEDAGRPGHARDLDPATPGIELYRSGDVGLALDDLEGQRALAADATGIGLRIDERQLAG